MNSAKLLKMKIDMARLKQPTQKEELAIYRELLIHLHTCNWTGHHEKVGKILEAIGAYSYARTNSNPGNELQEKRDRIRTLLNLQNI